MEGDFSVLLGNNGFSESSIKYLQDAYDAITRLGLWKELSEFTPNDGFMFSSSPFLGKIRSEMKFMTEHSGSSYGWTMRQMEFIAKNDWNKYIEHLKI
jgi:hypothetical protein